jgi:hypothetical protein
MPYPASGIDFPSFAATRRSRFGSGMSASFRRSDACDSTATRLAKSRTLAVPGQVPPEHHPDSHRNRSWNGSHNRSTKICLAVSGQGTRSRMPTMNN